MPQAELKAAYLAAKVHALPGWRETPGLAALEAAALGCNILITRDGTAQEYFGERAWYCDPSDVQSIKDGVLKAYAATKTTELQTHISENYTWELAAQLTYNAYQCAIDNQHRSLSEDYHSNPG